MKKETSEAPPPLPPARSEGLVNPSGAYRRPDSGGKVLLVDALVRAIRGCCRGFVRALGCEDTQGGL